MRVGLHSIFVCTALAAPLQPVLAENTAAPRPAWLNKAIAERRDARSRGAIEESTYYDKRVYLFTRGDRADTGDEHVLYSEDGKELCKFGGFIGIVTSGACDIEKIIYVRTLYPAKSQ